MAKQWDKDTKMKIINESYNLGIKTICKKYNLSPTTIKRWRSELRKLGEEALIWGLGRQAKMQTKRKYNFELLKPQFSEKEIGTMSIASLQKLAKSYLLLAEYTSKLEKKKYNKQKN